MAFKTNVASIGAITIGENAVPACARVSQATTERQWPGSDNADANLAENSEQEMGDGDDPNNNGAGRKKSPSLFASRESPRRAVKQKLPNTWS